MKSNIQAKYSFDINTPPEDLRDWILLLAKWYNKQGFFDVDDLVGEGYTGYFDAVNKFKPINGTKFKTYAEYRVIGAIVDYIRNNTPGKRNVTNAPRPKVYSIDDLLDTSDQELKPLYNVLLDKLSYGKDEPDIYLHDLLKDHINCLKDQQKECLFRYYWEDKNMSEIADELSLTESRISQVIGKATQLLKKRLDKGIVPKPTSNIFERRIEMKGSRLTEEEVQKRVQAIQDSKTIREAAQKLGVADATLHISGKKHPEIESALKEKRMLRVVPEEKKPAPRPTMPVKSEIKELPTRFVPDFGFKGSFYLFGHTFSVDISIRQIRPKDTVSA